VDFSIVNQIILSQISFSYKPESGLSDLKNIDLTINRGDRVGIVGLSGSGKSTLLYILMGLLKIGKGSLMVNNHDLHGTSLDAALMKYHMSIGYVPQEVHIVNGSFVDNIAFGVNNSEVDISRVKYCSSIAQLDGFIESLPGQYDYYLGKNGSRLSGGQKQRVGIARALYRNPSVLFFDECTSSLDLMTESDVMSALAELSSDITMVFIAHKVNTLSICNKVFELVNGSLRVVENPAFSGRV
jgi:ATP-binding cassette subfamily B protein